MLFNSLILLLLSNSITSRRDKSILYSRATITILLISAFIAYDGLFLLFLAKGIGIFGGLFHTTATTNFFHMFIFIITSVILLLTSFYPRKVWYKEYSSPARLLFTKLIYYETLLLNKMGEQFKIIEYSLIILFIVTGSVFLISTSDLVSIFLSIELQSYGLYLLSTIYRDSEPATSGGLMYFLLGGLSSCFILLGTALLYANSGTTNLDSLYIITSISDVTKDNLTGLVYWYKSYYIHISLLFIAVGFLFKVSAAPFHFWSPDVYDAIPTVVTTFVAIIAKISIFVFLLELVHYTSKPVVDMDFSWTTSLLFSSLLSLVIGTVVGLSQSRIKRLFAFSTISHVGFVLSGLMVCFSFTITPSPHLFYSSCYTSGYLSDKAKGKRKLESIEEDEQMKDKTNSEEDSEYERQLNLTKEESLKYNRYLKHGESSKHSQSQNQIDEDLFLLKRLKTEEKETAKQYNNIKIEAENKNVNEDILNKRLATVKQNYEHVKSDIYKIKHRLYENGIDPDIYTEQSSACSSYNSSEEYYSSDEERRDVKRVKFSDNNSNKPLFIVPTILNYRYLYSCGFNVLFLFISGLTIYMIDIDFIPNFVLACNVNLTQLLSLHLIVNLVMLLKKNYDRLFAIYHSYLNNDFFVIYTNVYLTIVVVILYFCVDIDISIFYC